MASRAIQAAITIANTLELPADDATVLHNSNRLALRLLPCDAFARVSPTAYGFASFEIELAQQIAANDGPVAALDPRVEPRGYELDGFEVSLWKYYETAPGQSSPADYAEALARLHTATRSIDLPTPHFTERVADPTGNVPSTTRLDDDDRELVIDALTDLGRAVVDHGSPEQLLHGEPHVGNVLRTKEGLRFIDLETCCRGPVEFDLAHLPASVGEHYPNADQLLLEHCKGLILAMVAKHRCAPDDEFPNRQRALDNLIAALRAGPPWPTLDAVTPSLDGS